MDPQLWPRRPGIEPGDRAPAQFKSRRRETEQYAIEQAVHPGRFKRERRQQKTRRTRDRFGKGAPYEEQLMRWTTRAHRLSPRKSRGKSTGTRKRRPFRLVGGRHHSLMKLRVPAKQPLPQNPPANSARQALGRTKRYPKRSDVERGRPAQKRTQMAPHNVQPAQRPPGSAAPHALRETQEDAPDGKSQNTRRGPSQ